MRLARALVFLVLLAASAVAVPAQDKPPSLESGKAHRGIAVLSSSLGHDISAEEIAAFAHSCKIDLVVVDFAWITHHWTRTDLATVEELAQRLRKQGVVVAAMYRPRLLRPDDAQVHLALDEKGVAPADHAELCFAWADSVDWGAQWGEKILAACPSIDHVLLYNVRAPCRCEKCKDGAGAKFAEDFVAACRTRWAKARPAVRVGPGGVGLEYAAGVDFVCPFLPVNREEAGTRVDAAALADASAALREKAAGKPFVPLAKVCWEQATNNTTEDVAAVVKTCDERKLGFVLWTYDWLFHPENGRYDPDALVRALGGSPEDLAKFLHPPAPAPADTGAADGRQWVFFDSREKGPAPVLALVGADGKETTVTADADTGLISYLADRNWGRLPSLAVSLSDTNRVLLRFPVKTGDKFERAELRLAMHLSDVAPQAPFDVAVHAVLEAWDEGTATWKSAPRFDAKPAATATLEAKDGEVRIDVTPLARAWTAAKDANRGLLIKTARAIPEGTTPIVIVDKGGKLVRKAIAKWAWAATPDEALAKARAAKRPVLAVVVVSADGQDVAPHEEILFSTVLSNPAVAELVASRFVPVRVALPAWQFVSLNSNVADPLKALGTNAQDASAPALVVARADGGHVATLASMGTFDHGLVLDFLRGALAKAGGPKAVAEEDPAKALARAEKAVAAGGAAAGAARVDCGVALMRLGRLEEAATALRDAIPGAGARANEAAYWLAAVLQKRGDGGARAVLEKLAGGDADDPWVAKAAMRLAWPVAVGVQENLVDPETGAYGKCDASSSVLRAVDFLLREQMADGSWPVANPLGEDFRAGISVLAAHALLTWSEDLDAARKDRATAALRRADGWLDAHVAKAPADSLNSFAAAYYVDYELDRLARKAATKEDVATALRQLAGGVCPSGAWSYSLQFGRSWRGNERTHSVNTALAVEAIQRAKAAGVDVDEKTLAGGVAALVAMRKGPAGYTYMYPGKPNFESDDASIARAPLCDMALLHVGKATKDDLRKSLEVFMKYRLELRATGKTSTPFWLPPHAYTSYFFHFAYYHAAEAFAALGDASSKKDLATLRDDLLGWAEPDGAWVDDLLLGKPYGTAATLLTLRVTGVRLRK